MRFIQVGVGGFGKVWLQCLTKNPQARIVGLVDVDQKALKQARAEGDYEKEICFLSLNNAIKNVDAVICVTPPENHKQCVTRAMRAGLDVITEKPMAGTLADCLNILKVSRETGRICVVSQNYRYSSEMLTLAKMVKNGRIGDIGQVKIDFYLGFDFGGGFRLEIDHPLIVDMSIHHFDLIRFITGQNAVTVRGHSWNPPWSNYKGDCSTSLIFEMENGGYVVYNASWCAKGQFCNWNGNWQIEGSKGTLLYEKNKISLYDTPKLYTAKKEKSVPMIKPLKTGQEYVLNNFMQAKRQNKRPETDVFDNINSIAMVFAAVRAVITGKRIPIINKRVQKLLDDE